MEHSNHIHAATDTASLHKTKKAFYVGIWLNLAYVAIEAAFGLVYDSMGLLSDAGHNLSDVVALVIALIAFKASSRQPDDRYTYGYRKGTVEASVANALILYMAVALILFESVKKLFHPVAVDGDIIAWVAGVGVIINGITTWMLMRGSHRDLNVKGAFLHMAADTLVSIGVVASGIVINITGWNIIDPLIGIVIAAVIAVGSYSMLRDSMRLALDGVPRGIDIVKVRQAIASTDGVLSSHHLHVWPISTTLTAMTVHVVIDNPADINTITAAVKKAVIPLGISHSTGEAETSSDSCGTTHEKSQKD